MSRAPRVLVLRAPGINCEVEAALAFARHGAAPEILHVDRLLERPGLLDAPDVFVIPGGFAYGDDLGAGRILANRLRLRLGERLVAFLEGGRLVLGICNGFQVLAKMGLLPRTEGGALRQQVSLTHNASHRYECRWVRLRCEESRCAFLPAGLVLEVPAAHGEGRYVPQSEALHRHLATEGFVALRYLPWPETNEEREGPAAYPCNPNGSPDGVAGLTDATGRALGLMPHPDRAFLPHHHPHWTRPGPPRTSDGNEIFRAMVRLARQEQ